MCCERGGIAIVVRERKENKERVARELIQCWRAKIVCSLSTVYACSMCIRACVCMCACDVDVKYAIRDMVANLRRIKIEHANWTFATDATNVTNLTAHTRMDIAMRECCCCLSVYVYIYGHLIETLYLLWFKSRSLAHVANEYMAFNVHDKSNDKYILYSTRSDSPTTTTTNEQ